MDAPAFKAPCTLQCFRNGAYVDVEAARYDGFRDASLKLSDYMVCDKAKDCD